MTAVNGHDWRAQALADATVHLICAPGEAQQVRAWVDRQPPGVPYVVRESPFVPPGKVLAVQRDGVHAPPAVTEFMRRL